ncbi:cartilage matrix protein-like [Xenia sp. Carnegie-2017]|uniref:cartilage matrix protein-like n=1 Tax=Xenia sp. Carnegie-2017 TaxID=2897299 RepID=UPI001F039294|nr:cartilage matrix protein-like [Xenia sp. Carnegie-2017]
MPGPLIRGRTKTHHGLAVADTQVVVKSAGYREDDPDVTKFFMVVTDGEQTIHSRRSGYKYVREAMQPFFKRRNLNIFAVGIGLEENSRGYRQVKDMVKDEENAFFPKNFKDLNKITMELINKLFNVSFICASQKDDCHPSFAKCTDTSPGKYTCKCIVGYTGDGKQCIRKNLQPMGDGKFYEEFMQIPSKEASANHLLTNFLHVKNGVRNKTRKFFEDIVILLDSSGSIRSREFKKGKCALKYLINAELPDSYNIYWAGVQYSYDATIIFDFVPTSQAANKSHSFTYEGRATNTAEGLKGAKQLFDRPRRGSRPGSWKKVLLVTDGQYNVNKMLSMHNAYELKHARVEIFVIVIGKFPRDIEEIYNIASPHHKIMFLALEAIVISSM